jgi:ribose-phosphate pyrophosphokinase
MRQDMRFRAGEAVTSRSFARLLGSAFDGLVTIDPHLHRWPSLAALYPMPALALPSAPAIAGWLQAHVPHPHLIGPDEESLQWVAQVAALAGCGHSVARKQRRGDRDVRLEMPPLEPLAGCVPVLLDDIVSSGRTLAVAAEALHAGGLAPPACIIVHPLFAGDAEAVLRAAGVSRIVSCNTVTHPSNGIDIGGALADGSLELLAAGDQRSGAIATNPGSPSR